MECSKTLKELGVDAVIDPYTVKLALGEMPELLAKIQREHAQIKQEYDFIRWYYKAITDSDGILVVNLDKNGVENYIGSNTFLEIGYAHALKKKIYLLHPLPHQEYIRDELGAMNPIILNGDLRKFMG